MQHSAADVVHLEVIMVQFILRVVELAQFLSLSFTDFLSFQVMSRKSLKKSKAKKETCCLISPCMTLGDSQKDKK